MTKIEMRFAPAKETKNTYKFDEIVLGDNEAKVGTLYVPKSTLNELGWADSSGATALTVTIEFAS